MPKPDWNRADVASIGLILAWFWPHNFGIRFEAWKKCHKNSVQVYSFMWIIRRLCIDSKPQFCEQTNYTCRIDLSVCCPCWFRIWQLNCQNNFLPSGSAGGKSMKIATKFNIVGSILVWYIHINTFLARAIIKLTVFHCRFATMSPEMREMEHGGCRIASPARAVRALFRLESWATRVGEVDRGTSASSRMTGSAPR